MDGEVIQQLAARFRGPTEIGGFLAHPNDWAVHDPASLVKPGPKASALAVSTLAAVCDYAKANRDGLDLATCQLHVAGPNAVTLWGPLDARDRKRECFVHATSVDTMDGFLGKFWPLADFNIALQTRFTRGGQRDALLRLLGNVKGGLTRTALDDGLTQTVEVKVGVALVDQAAVPNPVQLAPWRTFREVAQPEPLFVLRLKDGDPLPQAALFEADAGEWRLTAIERSARWLRTELGDTVAILA